jgi:hypothetical protein
MASGQVRHRHIPDSPVVESERRQIFFGMAIGIPTFYVRKNTRNRFLLKILKLTDRVRSSRRYPGYLRIYHQNYCLALLKLLREDAADLIEMFRFAPLLDELQERIEQPRHSAAGRLIGEIAGGTKAAMAMDASEFNRAAETYYREKLRRQHVEQSFNLLKGDLQQLESAARPVDRELRPQLDALMAGRNPLTFLQAIKADLLNDNLGVQPLVRLLNLMLLCEQRDRLLTEKQEENATDPPVYRALQRPHL